MKVSNRRLTLGHGSPFCPGSMDVIGYNQVRGLPFAAAELVDVLSAALEEVHT